MCRLPCERRARACFCSFLLAAITAACGCGGSGGGSPTTGTAEGYLYANTDCSSANGPAYIISDSAVPPPSYKPVADRAVSLLSRENDEYRHAFTRTGPDGHLSFRYMPPRSYVVQVLPTNFSHAYFFPTFRVTVEAGKTSKQFETAWAGSFTGYFTYDPDCNARGIARWMTSEMPQYPLTNAHIEMERSVECAVSVETDATGHIMLDHLQTGLYTVTVPIEACGKSMTCGFSVGDQGDVHDDGCYEPPAELIAP